MDSADCGKSNPSPMLPHFAMLAICSSGLLLKRAEALTDDGRLQDAWKMVRLALERLYTIVFVAHLPDFDPVAWRGQTAESCGTMALATSLRGSHTELVRD